LKAVFQLYMRAYAELELWSKPIITIRYATRDKKSKIGQLVDVNLTSPPCKGTFLIQEVTIDQIHDESDQLTPRYTVTASSTRFELTDLLLQIIGTSPAEGISVAGVATTAIQTASALVTGTLTLVTYTLTSSQMKSSNTSPIEIVAAPGAGLINNVISVVIH